ncbi:MAG TPA: cbb3-type cytochrome c oxidase subunit I, partial [Mariniphaga sp.]|nr:cbb3-type cytochrome c oxidase subunit I [Mariniphaga sp.]
STMYKGSINIQTPFLWAVSFIFVFMIGGLSGLVVGSLAANVYVHDTYFVVAHFHYIVFGGTGFAFLGAMHYWFPKMFGRMYDKAWANIGWLIFFIGFLALYSPMFYLGMQGMPRRYYDYLEEFHGGNIIATIGSWVLITGFIIILANLITSARKGEKVGKNPWNSKTLEWTVPSPPPLENFDEIPVLEEKDGPYNYD